jgi:hypothetical protein
MVWVNKVVGATVGLKVGEDVGEKLMGLEEGRYNKETMVGEIVCLQLGVKVGFGTEDGRRVGVVGREVGGDEKLRRDDGQTVGESEGTAEGEIVGKFVGLKVGELDSVGRAVATREGATLIVGTTEGKNVGTKEGEAVN